MKRRPITFTGWRRLRQQNDERRVHAPLYFEEFCEDEESSDRPVGMIRKIDEKQEFVFTRYPDLQSPTRFLRGFSRPVREARGKLTLALSFSTLTQKVYHPLFPSNATFDNDWFGACDEYIHGLSLREKMALVAMTNKSQQHVQALSIHGRLSREFCDRVRAWRDDVYGYLPIFFQLARIDETTNLRKEYRRVLQDVCPLLTDDEITRAVEGLAGEIRRIFQRSPPTKKRMVLTRGLKKKIPIGDDNYMKQGFTACTLDPIHALTNYTGSGGCCLQRVILLPGTRVLFLGGLSSFKADAECLISDRVRFYRVGESYMSLPTTRRATGCPNPQTMTRMLVQDVVAII